MYVLSLVCIANHFAVAFGAKTFEDLCLMDITTILLEFEEFFVDLASRVSGTFFLFFIPFGST